MTFECELKRYAAYFRGWSQAFGEIDRALDSSDGISWLLARDQVGLILPERLRKEVYREVLGTRPRADVLVVSGNSFQLGRTRAAIDEGDVREALKPMLQTFTQSQSLHMYLTYHLTYPSGTRFVTISTRAPLRLIYKQIEPMSFRIDLAG